MNSQWFLPSLVGVFWIASPAIAGEVTSWKFDPAQNRLEFTTDEGVQPRAQLVLDPTRLVIDLPNTNMGEVQSSQQLSGGLRQIRLSQFDANTARIVVELAPGYLLDPQQVQFRGLTATDWVVQIPPVEYGGPSAIGQPAVPESPIAPASLSPAITSFPQRLPTAAPVDDPTSVVATPIITMPPPRDARVLPDRPSSRSPLSPSSSPSPSSPPSPVTSAPPASDPSVTQIESLRTTTDGLFIQTSGAEPDIDDIDRSRNRRSITITIANAVLSPQFTELDSGVEQFGIEQLQVEPLQDDDEPPSVQITLTVDRDAPNWTASASNLGGIVLLPREQRDSVARRSSATRDIDTASRERDSSRRSERRRRRERTADSQSSESSPPSESGAAAESELPVATIEGIELDPSGSQLLIRSDRPVTYAGQWRSGIYQVQLSPARLAAQVSGPQLESDSPLRRVRLREEEDDTVVVMIQPAAGVRFGALSAVTPQLLALEMERSASTALTPPLPGRSNQPYPPPSDGVSASPVPSTTGRIPNGQIVIAIDPGHGGADVGAVGIGDLYEADVVLPIAQQVGALLQQQGIYVVMTRNDDREIDLEPRVQMAERANATLFVSIHANSMGMDRPDINGTETYYYSSGEGLAEVIQTNIVSRVGMTDRGIKQARFYVLRHTTMPAVLVELGYVTGSEDAPRLGNRNFQAQMAEAIAQGIMQYVRSLASQ